MTIPSQNDVKGMADLIAALGDVDPFGLTESAAPTPAPAPVRNMPAHFQPGDIDPISGLPIEADFDPSDTMPVVYDSKEHERPQRVPIATEDSAAMANILRAFLDSGGDKLGGDLENQVSTTSATLREDSARMPELRQAIATERTPKGVRVGGWEITTEGNSKKYDVVSVHSGQQIAKNLYLYEAAESLVNYLNDGCMINNMKVQNILRLEMEYAKHIEDAIQHKHACSKALDRGDDTRLEISKTRFNEAKTKAVAAKSKLLEHLGLS
jgi:hypothetical protein